MSTRKLGKYLMLETIGQGGFSKVRLGLDEQTGERVALKILRKNEMGNVGSDVIKQVERELNAMSQISSPNVIRLKEVDWNCTYEKKNGTKLQVILVVLELATGGELFDFLSFTGPFDEVIARNYFHQLINGLADCHRLSICHRDIKPENLLLDSKFVLKIADFGFAAAFNQAQNLMYTNCGTPGYQAPETFTSSGPYAGRGYDGMAADIWSAGVVLFIQLAGFPPFQKPNMGDWWFHKLSSNKHHLFWEAHQRTAYFSDLVKDFLNKILCPDPAKRITMAEIQRHPWMLGPTISGSALFAELQRRKQTVDEHKDRQRAEKAAKVLGADDAGLLERGDVAMMRGEGTGVIDYASESLPAAVPSIATFGKAAPTLPMGGAGAPFADSDDFSFGGSSSSGASPFAESDPFSSSSSFASAAPAATAATAVVDVPLFNAHMQSFTRFSTDVFSSPRDLLDKLLRSLRSVGCTVQTTPAQLRIKRAKCVTSQGVVEFGVGLFRDPRDSRHLIVDFKRLSADSAQFRSLYDDITDSLVDIISKNPTDTMRLAGTQQQ